MMKKYIYMAIMLMAIVVEGMAQQREFPALLINFKDGTSDLVTYPFSGYKYGVENPQDGDYITCSLERYESSDLWYPGNMLPSYSLTEHGEVARRECTKTGLIFSDAPIDTAAIDVTTLSEFYCIIGGKSWNYDSAEELCISHQQVLGEVYYCIAYYVLDGNTYYSHPLEKRIPKSLSDELTRHDIKALFLDKENVVSLDSDDVERELVAHYGYVSSKCIDSLLVLKEAEYFETLTRKVAEQSATDIEICDDGKIYYLDLPVSYVQDIISYVEQKGSESFYVKATKDVAIFSSAGRLEFTTQLATGTELLLVDCAEEWGVKDNQYLYTNIPTASNLSPSLVLNLNHIMVPGKKYNVTFSLAPQTDEESVDTLDLEFYVLMADADVNDAYPTHVETPKATSKYFVKNTADDSFVFVGYADRVTSYTFEYTPEQLVFGHAFKVMNRNKIMSLSNKKKYGHNIRLIGVEVTPVE